MFTKDKAFYKSFIHLALALMLEQAVVLSVNLADNLMLGTYSEAALSGVAAVNQIQFVYQQLVYAIGNALVVLGSQYWGQRRTGEIRSIAAVAIRLEILLALGLFILVSIFPGGAVRIFTEQELFVQEGVKYLNIMRFSYVFFALTAVLLSSMRVVETVKIALRVSIVSLVINISINYLLIAGNLGAPELGAEGAAIGTLTARIVEFIIVGCFVLRDKKLGLRLRHLLPMNRTLARDYMRVAVVMLFTSLCWGLFTALQTVILGHMNDSAIAAQSISNTVYLLLKVAAVGAGSAAAVIIGKTVGAGDMDRLKCYSRTLQLLFVGIGASMALLMFLIRLPLLRIYSARITPETYGMANTYMLIQSATLLFMSYELPVNTGIIRGGGDPRFVMIMDMCSLFIFIPVAYVCAFVLELPAVFVIISMNIDQMLKCFPAFFYSNSYRWVHRLTRAQTE